MKTKIVFFIAILISFQLIFNESCKKEGTGNGVATGPVPVLSTSAVTSIGADTATCGGNITSDRGKKITERGVCFDTLPAPTTAKRTKTDTKDTLGQFSVKLTNLIPNTTYYIRAYAINSAGTGYGNELSFSTTAIISLPTVTTNETSGITSTTAISGGNVTDDGNSSVTSRGVCWSTSPNPVISGLHTTNSTGTGAFISNITGLTPNTTYYVRAYANNSKGTGYGTEKSFTTLVAVACPSNVIDISGTSYPVVAIGTQCWMKENLRVTKYTDNTTLSNIMDGSAWSSLTTGAYCYYDNNSYYIYTYGYLYNWYAVNSIKNICPSGWHVPSNAEWQTLIDYLGGFSVAGGKMKESGYANWSNPNTGADNSSYFIALPGGNRNYSSTFNGLTDYAYFWSSDAAYNWKTLFSGSAAVASSSASDTVYSNMGFSVRCVKN